MKSYLPRFTLRRALIGIAVLALFLGWLRPDRAEWCWYDDEKGIVFSPMWPECHIGVGRIEKRTPLGGKKFKVKRTNYQFTIGFGDY